MPRVIFQVSDREKALMVEAAHRELVTLSEWLRRAAEVRLGGLGAAVDESAGRTENLSGTTAGGDSGGVRPTGVAATAAPSPSVTPDFKKGR